ncbi:MAG TPA: flagellar basal-body MS-ring/collar protein FliF [Bryobacteraceae bacterium]|nr:flagellar basal-body MS-ring/collar protein FliF [Bryobacteraceae bacterium]
MNQILQLFRRLSIAQRIWLAAAALAVLGAIAGLAHWNQERDFKPLFTGIAAEDAGPLLARLREGTVEYRLADSGTTVLVPSARVAELRIEMASAGLPKSGRIGFELFDKANFGASEFAEQVNYHRAIEGELERSVMSIREVEQARVHITLAKDSLYSETRQAAKASVLVKLRHAAALSAQNIAAICQLTASAVPGLSPDQVSLVDTGGNLLNRPRANAVGDGTAATEATLDYRKSVEHDLQAKIAATLDPLLGADHFRTGVSADVDFTSADQSEELFDPNKSVMVTSQHTQDGPALPSASGVPGTPSNLPRPTSRPATGSSSYSRSTENISYQTSRVVKHTRLPQGGVKRLSLSVLVDHTLRWEGNRRVIEPPSAEKLKVIKDLVTAAAGLDTNRGDQLVVEAFPFESTLMAEPVNLNPPAAAAPPPSRFAMPAWLEKLRGRNLYALIGVGAGALIALVAGFVVLRRRSRERRRKVEVAAAAALEAGKPKPITPEELEREMEDKLAERTLESARQEAEALMALKIPVVKTKKTEVLTKHIAAEAKKNPALQAQVVRTWMRG